MWRLGLTGTPQRAHKHMGIRTMQRRHKVTEGVTVLTGAAFPGDGKNLARNSGQGTSAVFSQAAGA